MPIYEFYCKPCNTIFNFYSKTVNVTKKPACPRCAKKLERRISLFSFSQKTRGAEALPFKTQQAEAGVRKLKKELDRLKDKDPREAERFKKKFERWSGVTLGHDVRTPARTADESSGEEKKAHHVLDPDEPLRDENIYEL